MCIISALEKLCQISSNTLRLSSMLNDVFFLSILAQWYIIREQMGFQLLT